MAKSSWIGYARQVVASEGVESEVVEVMGHAILRLVRGSSEVKWYDKGKRENGRRLRKVEWTMIGKNGRWKA
ncbi:hypothetical protein E4U43_006436 [Claviceps pusilla]|uniref:Uncharacterized protein n=1 Tax=Claviceps pusilla TaxID=123648 RepID=A0A9P7NFY0_9HYPO|nr:hypothetical protein E4U43_006436 [Claviceps pusilla]